MEEYKIYLTGKEKRFTERKEYMLEAIRQNPMYTQYISNTLKNDEEFMIEVRKLQTSESIRTSDNLKNNEDIALDAKKNESSSEKTTNEELEILEKIGKDAKAIQEVSNELMQNKEFLLKAIKENSYIIIYLNDDLKNDKDIVLEAIKKHIDLFEYASDELKNNKEFIEKFIDTPSEYSNEEIFEYVSDDLKNDKEFVMKIIKEHGRLVEYASEELKNDMDIALTALYNDRNSIKHLNKELFTNKEKVLKLVKINSEILSYAPYEFRQDRDIISASIEANGHTLSYAKYNDLIKDKELILKALETGGSIIEYADISLREDKQFILEAINVVPEDSIFYLIKNLKNDLIYDEDIALAAIKKRGTSIHNFGENIKNNRKFSLLAVQENGVALERLNDNLKNDEDIVLAALKNKKDLKPKIIFREAGEDIKKDKEFVLRIIDNMPDILEYVSDDLKKDKAVVIKAVKQNGMLLEWASDDLQNDKDVVTEAIKQNPLAKIFASNEINESLIKSKNKETKEEKNPGKNNNNNILKEEKIKIDEKNINIIPKSFKDYSLNINKYFSKETKEEELLKKIESHLSLRIYSTDIIKDIAKNILNNLKTKHEDIFNLQFIQEFLNSENKEESFSKIEKYYKEKINYSLPDEDINKKFLNITNNNIRIGQIFEFFIKNNEIEAKNNEENSSFNKKEIQESINYISLTLIKKPINNKSKTNENTKNNIDINKLEEIYKPNPFSIITLFNDLNTIRKSNNKDIFHLSNIEILEKIKKLQETKIEENTIPNFDLIRSKQLNQLNKNEEAKAEFKKNLLKKDTVVYIIKNKNKQVEQTYLGFEGLNKILEDYPLVKESLNYNELNESNIVEAYTRIEELIAIKYGNKLLPNLIFAPIVELGPDYNSIFNEQPYNHKIEKTIKQKLKLKIYNN
jgi:uncharacterized protein (UPF0262 family)